jgi:hypothetical protein
MTDYRAELQRLLGAVENDVIDTNDGLRFQAAVNRAHAALAQSEPLAPLIDAGNERLRLVAAGIRFGYMAVHDATVDGHYGDPDEVASEMAEVVIDELDALAQPEPVGSKPSPNYNRVQEIATEAEIRAAARYLIKKKHCDGDLIPAIEYAIARWGRPTIKPVPVSERPWEREGWCDLDGECWWGCELCGVASWAMVNPARVDAGWLLPHHALPVPGAEVSQ